MSLSPLSRVFTPAEAAILAERIPGLPPEQRERAMEIVRELARQESQRLMFRMFPDEDSAETTGEGLPVYPARRRFPKHLEFFEAGATHRERAAVCANRVGKTFGMGGYETALHLTGLYPHWWPGRRFERPVDWWAAGDTTETTRDIIQLTLFGKVTGETGKKSLDGTGTVPGATLGKVTWRNGVPDMVDTVQVKHASGGWSRIGLKSFDQKRRSFQGTAKDGVWLDEECPEDVYDECLVRTLTTNGLVMLTFTPLQGRTPLVNSFYSQDEIAA